MGGGVALGVRHWSLRTVVDWYVVQKRDEAAILHLEPVAGPARPDVLTENFGKEKVAFGTAIRAEDKALVPWIFMQQQLCWCRREYSIFLVRRWPTSGILDFCSYSLF
jgi:hypothetical protein